MFSLNLKIALRNLWKYKGYTFINVGGLAIGLACCMVLLLYVAYEWGYDKQFKNYKNTYVVYTNNKTVTEESSYPYTPWLLATELDDKIPGVAFASHSTYPENQLIAFNATSLRTNAVFADPAFLKMLDYKFIKGNPDQVLQEVNTVILTASLAKKLFGAEDPINQTVKLENEELLKVQAVIEDVPKNSTIQFDYLMPWSLYEKRNPWIKDAGWSGMFCLTMVQLQDNKFVRGANDLIKGVYKRNEEETMSEAMLHPLEKWHLYGDFENGKSVGGKISQVRLFFILAFCILLIACVNFMNLSTARSEKRAKEVGVRKVIGSTRNLIIGQFMLESILLSFLGMLLAFALIEVSLPYFNGLLNTDLVINYLDWKFWCALLGLTILTGFIAGSYPAFYLSSFEPVKVLKGFNIGGGSSLSIRKVLVVFQFVFAACLIVCTSVIYQQINYIKNKPIGYNKNNLLEVAILGDLKDEGKLKLLEAELLKTGGITSLTDFSRSLGNEGHRTFNIGWPGKSKNEQVLFNYRNAGYNFSKTIGAKMITGRDFSLQFNDSANVLVNQAAVKVMGLKDPIGKVVDYGDKRVTIIGVIEDFIVESPYQQVVPMIIANEGNKDVLLARLNPAQNISESVAKIDEVFKKFNPNFPVERKFVDDNFEAKFQNEKLLGTVANWFGGFAIFISCLGLLGLALYMAEQRKKEISIRKVLGASNMSIISLLNKDFIKLVAIANLIAFPLAYLIINKWLSTYSYRVAISVLPFAIALGISSIIAVLTVSLQSVKVAKANPVEALKYE